jgi:alpha-1,2-mannosyltransferase
MEPVQRTLLFGQVNLLVMVVIMIDLCQPDDKLWKGFGVGLAVGFKLTPAIFILFLLLTRRFRAAAVAFGTFVLTVLVGYIILPIESGQYWGGLFLDSSRIGVAYVGNQSLNGTLIRLFQGIAPAHPYWLIVAVLIGIVGVGLAAWVSLKGEELLGILTCALTGLLVSPISWSHHWVWVAPLMVLLIHLAVTRHVAFGWLAVGLFALFSDWLGIIWRVPRTGFQEFHWSGFEHIEGELYVIMGMSLLALLAFVVLRRSRYGVTKLDEKSVHLEEVNRSSVV